MDWALRRICTLGVVCLAAGVVLARQEQRAGEFENLPNYSSNKATLDYVGALTKAVLELDSISRFNGYKGHESYVFVPAANAQACRIHQKGSARK
jgi:hypothetical protein